jgi:hypothetical protein
MAINSAYATATEYKTTFGKTDTADDAIILTHLTAVSRFYEREAGQFFNLDASAVARVFRAKYPDVLWLNEDGFCPGVGELTGFEIKVDTDNDGSFADETAWASTDYELHPLNAADGPEARPWHLIRVPNWSTKSFQPGSLVQVTARYGWPAVPEAVKANVIELTGIWRSESPRGTGRLAELDEIVQTSPMAMSLVKKIRNDYAAKVTF